MNYENLAKLLFFIEKYNFRYMCQLIAFCKAEHDELLEDLEEHRMLFVNFLCKLRGCY